MKGLMLCEHLDKLYFKILLITEVMELNENIKIVWLFFIAEFLNIFYQSEVENVFCTFNYIICFLKKSGCLEIFIRMFSISAQIQFPACY